MNNRTIPVTPALLEILDELGHEPAGTAPPVAEGRLREVVRGGAPFTAGEQRALLRSAVGREWLLQVWREEHSLAWLRWQQAEALPGPVACLAAASGEVQPLDLKGDGFALLLYPLDEAGREWRLVLRVEERLRRLTPGGFRLRDEEGRPWLAGPLDADGELRGYWEHDEPLWQAAHRCTLRLEPR